jgi:hypothetical protein
MSKRKKMADMSAMRKSFLGFDIRDTGGRREKLQAV